MAEVQGGEKNLLMSKWGPLPVWAWSAIGLLAAWLFAKWRDSQAAKKQDATDQTDTADTGDASESQQVAPQFIIENNMPAGVGAPTTPSAPVPTTPSVPGPVITPPKVTPNPPTPPKKTIPPPKKAPTPKKPVQYKVKHGDTLSSIAARYHTTWQALWTYNTTAGNRPASTITTLKKRGPNLLYAGETILIPQK